MSHEFPPDGWWCSLCGAMAGSIDAKLTCMGSAAEPTADRSPACDDPLSIQPEDV